MCRIVASAGWVLFLLILVAPIVIADMRPIGRHQVDTLGSEDHWVCRINYNPGGSIASIEIQMDNMGHRDQSEYTIESSEDWFPRLAGTIDGPVGDFARVQFDVTSPRSLDVDEAAMLAKSLRVIVMRDSGQRIITFSERYTAVEGPSLLQRVKSFWIDTLREPTTKFH
jgi:hypothetical protein